MATQGSPQGLERRQRRRKGSSRRPEIGNNLHRDSAVMLSKLLLKHSTRTPFSPSAHDQQECSIRIAEHCLRVGSRLPSPETGNVVEGLQEPANTIGILTGTAVSDTNADWSKPDSTCKCKLGFSGADKVPGEDGVCSLCPPGTYKDVVGSFPCSLCPPDSYCTGGTIASCMANSNSLEGSSQISDCACKAGYRISTTSSVCICASGYTAGPNGGPCTACVVGKYKALSGNVACDMCPENSYSPLGSVIATACVCNAGSSGPIGGTCATCIAGK